MSQEDDSPCLTLIDCVAAGDNVLLYARTEDGKNVTTCVPRRRSGVFVELTETFTSDDLDKLVAENAALISDSEILHQYKVLHEFSPHSRSFARITPVSDEARKELGEKLCNMEIFETTPDIEREFMAEQRVAVGDTVRIKDGDVKPAHRPNPIDPNVLYVELDADTVRYVFVENGVTLAKRALVIGADPEDEGEPDCFVDYFASVKDSLTRFADAVRELDPDVIMYYSVEGDDMVKIVDRMREHGVPGTLSRLSSASTEYSEQENCLTRVYFDCPGRVIVNLADAVPQRDANVTVLADRLGVKLVPEKDGPELIFECNRVIGFIRDLYAKANVLRSTVNVMLECPVEGHFALLLTTLFVQNRFLLRVHGDVPEHPNIAAPEKVCRPGHYKSPVTVLKFVNFTAYTIIAYNLCMSTLIDDKKHARWLEENPQLYHTVEGFKFASGHSGMLPMALSHLLDGQMSVSAQLLVKLPDKNRWHLKSVYKAFNEVIAGGLRLCERPGTRLAVVGALARLKQDEIMQEVIDRSPGDAIYSDDDALFLLFEGSEPLDACTLSNYFMNEFNEDLRDPVELVTDSMFSELVIAGRGVFFGINHSDLGKTVVTAGLPAPEISEDKTLEEACEPLFAAVRERCPDVISK